MLIATKSQKDESDTSLSISFSTKINQIIPIDAMQLENDEKKSYLPTMEWIDNNSDPAVDIFIVESERRFATPIPPHSIGESSGISFGNDMSVVDYGESGKEIEKGDGNEKIDENPERSETGASHFSSFSSTHSCSQLKEHVKNFIEEVSPPTFQVQLAEKPLIEIRLDDSLRQLIGMISPASEVQSSEEHNQNAMFNIIAQPTGTMNRSRKTTSSTTKSSSRHSIQTQHLRPVPTSPQIDNEEDEKLVQPLISLVSSQESLTSRTKHSVHKENVGDVPTTRDILFGPNRASEDEFSSSPQHNAALFDDIEMCIPLISPSLPLCILPNPDDMNKIADYDSDHGENSKDVPIDRKVNDSDMETDDDGMVCDEHGCVFINDDEFQNAWYVYIENDGLAYLQNETFKAANVTLRKRVEREFRTIYKIINRRFASPRQNFEDDVQSSNESILHTARGTAKRKSSSKSSIDVTKRRTVEHLREGSICSYRSDVSGSPTRLSCSPLQSFNKQKKSISNESSDSEKLSNKSYVQTPQCNTIRNSSVNEANADVSNYASDDERQNLKFVNELQVKNNKCKAAGCDMVNYLTDFVDEREICDIHNVLLIQLIEE